MKSRGRILGALAILIALGVVVWPLTHRRRNADDLIVYGNVDLRQVDLPFNGSERIATVMAQEGDHVKRGQILARLDTSRLEPQVAQEQAQVDAQQAVVDRFHNGSRPEEIAQARANLISAEADAANYRREYDRQNVLWESDATSRESYDNARAIAATAAAKVEVNRKALELALVGPRKEDVAQAEAQLRGDQAQLALLRQQLADAELVAPLDAVVRSRLMEPGEMASPQKPVFSLAITNPKWVRAYVSESELGRVHPGMGAFVVVDAFPDRRFDGWVGFVSPVAEFTPKAVQTEELRTSLVYEIRVFVKDPADELRLGMPATVYLPRVATNVASPSGQMPFEVHQ